MKYLLYFLLGFSSVTLGVYMSKFIIYFYRNYKYEKRIKKY